MFDSLTGFAKKALREINPKNRWASPQGYKEVLTLCLPLVASSIAASAMMFTDRIFLSNHSLTSIAAALPAGVIKFTITSVFMGIVAYTGVFVSQYTGAGEPGRASRALWQGLWLSLVFGALHWLLLLRPEWIFSFGAKEPEIVKEEITYFSVLVMGTPVELCMVTMSAFLASTGRAKIVMWVNLGATALNIPLDYFLIFGLGSGENVLIPSMGIYGAALATLFSWVANFVLLALFVFNDKFEKSHGTRSEWAPDPALLKRVIKYGTPNGVQFFMEIFTFAFFSFAVGTLGGFRLAANNIVFSVEALSFFPMVGLGQAVSILVGQAIGRGAPLDGERVTVSGIVLSTAFVCLMFVLFVFFPEPILESFVPDDLDPPTKAELIALGAVLLKFVAVYMLFDGLYLCCFGAIKGAGDIWIPMLIMSFWGLFGLVIPILILIRLEMANIYNMWACMVFYVIALTINGAWRFLTGKWKKKKVIERVATAV
ncbi:MAG: MATE family efflux transporter [Deltaproteobacteria bacterium]|jgi:MATE family multidrug resistance protein|nr:MATE family efflux transporter [Deltaproteobacteria bacterium]